MEPFVGDTGVNLVILGSVVASVVVLALVTVTVCFLVRRRRRFVQNEVLSQTKFDDKQSFLQSKQLKFNKTPMARLYMICTTAHVYFIKSSPSWAGPSGTEILVC